MAAGLFNPWLKSALLSRESVSLYYLFFREEAINIKTFYDWCIENNHQDYLDLWDYELNELNPKEVASCTHKKYYFKCHNHYNHPSALKRLDNIVHQPHSIECKTCMSLGWYLEQNDMLDYWDYDKNIVDPYTINSQTNKKIWIKCLENVNHPSYEVTGAHFVIGTRCPYCRGLKVTPQESLAFVCDDIDLIWSDKNTTSPEQYTPHSNKSVWWKCKNGLHEDFYRSVAVMNVQNFHCPRCSDENKTSYLQSMVKSYFQELGYTVKNEGDCSIIPISPITGHKLPYDNEVVELKLITEVHGMQHYKPQICSWYKHGAVRDGLTLEEYIQRRKYCDDYKKEYALENGYSFLEIPYWTEKNDEYKELINQKIKEIV